MPQAAYKQAYPKLSGFYFFYFTLFGAVIPYISLYYQSLGMDAIQIGQLMAVFVGTKVIAPNLLGWLADKTGKTVYWLRWTGFLTLVSATGFLFFQSFSGLLLTVFFFSFFFHAALPLFESYTFSNLAGLKERYGQIRLWGSIGFIAAVLGVGWQLQVFTTHAYQIYPVVLWGTSIIVFLTMFWVQDFESTPTEKTTETPLSFLSIIKRPWVISLLLVTILAQFSHGAYYSFYSIFLQQHGYSQTAIAWLWSVGVIAEIGVFFFMPRLFRSFSVKLLLLISLLLTFIRWMMIPYVADWLSLLILAQTFHAASYGLFHAAAIHLIDEHFHGVNQSRGQAIYASVSHGFGGGIGMLVAGYAWQAGGASLAFSISAISISFALFITQKWVQSSH
ncbi:MFS transporter [Hydrogenovibrio marinus]|uniref:MFS transporter n=1 Tax=Hydrogenovibrio marinus TaxID=28885 RepID=A0A066ZQ17_HYDMR|nr:MFS transporter [Hydrogenovibrio marinus]KDN95597.1 MFS transporter [Hydrogenovibrio marinus]BBN60092.1 MFS metabolite transporter [Hydrogenovibrio marinus]